ncbi:hypothetical protein SAY87_029870 [Trapa incisa]|uniref:DUF7356 domain-containing protein n=1 Tax=Trapa incisa TaxID=236973 RepID=A0AAN7Q9F4_9MYRT|nr:hypothetical protein SAY87_029870 [Trapa incisa]
MPQTPIISLVLALALILIGQSDAFPDWKFTKLARILADTKSGEKVSPAPSPGSDPGEPKGPGNGAAPTGTEGCSASSQSCHVKHLSACLRNSGSAPKEAFLVLWNSGEVPLKVKVSFLPANITSDDIQLAGQHSTEVNVTTKIQGNSYIVLNAGDGDCVIKLKPPAPQSNFYDFLSNASEVKPIHGVYLFFATVLLIGGVWACCKFGKNERRINGVAYQELEMGRIQADSALADNVETVEGWDESWDDDWGDEIREVKSSPSRSWVGNGSVNDHKSESSNKDGGKSTWND